MRSIRVTLAALGVATALTVSACEKEGPAERAGKKVDEAVDDAGDAAKDAGDKVGDAMQDAGDKVKDAVD